MGRCDIMDDDGRDTMLMLPHFLLQSKHHPRFHSIVGHSIARCLIFDFLINLFK